MNNEYLLGIFNLLYIGYPDLIQIPISNRHIKREVQGIGAFGDGLEIFMIEPGSLICRSMLPVRAHKTRPIPEEEKKAASQKFIPTTIDQMLWLGEGRKI
ncbi:MAG: hypothetical protein LUQ47_03325 [Methanotrichaceae archaeon]|nr:hypothetical protein [Methanotrichaceae archaeon]